MWMYAYESVVQGTSPGANAAFIEQDTFFSLLHGKRIRFLAIDNGFTSIATTLRSLRSDNDRMRRLRDDFIDDFDLTLDEFDDDDDNLVDGGY